MLAGSRALAALNEMQVDRTPLELVRSVLAELGDDFGYEHLSSSGPDTPLFGGPDGIDSLTLVHVVTGVERAAERTYRRRVVLSDERAMSRRSSPFRTVGTLAALLEERLSE